VRAVSLPLPLNPRQLSTPHGLAQEVFLTSPSQTALETSNASLSAKLLRILSIWKHHLKLDREMGNVGVAAALSIIEHKVDLEEALSPGAREQGRRTEAMSTLFAKYSDDESIQLIGVSADRFPLEALARFLVAAVPLAPSEIRSLIDFNLLIRRLTIDRYAPIPKLAFGAVVGTMLFLLKEVPQVVIEKIGLAYDDYQVIVALSGAILLAYLALIVFFGWSFLAGLRSDFSAVDRLLRAAALVSGVDLQGRAQENKNLA
jgi:hypothetical protein